MLKLNLPSFLRTTLNRVLNISFLVVLFTAVSGVLFFCGLDIFLSVYTTTRELVAVGVSAIVMVCFQLFLETFWRRFFP